MYILFEPPLALLKRYKHVCQLIEVIRGKANDVKLEINRKIQREVPKIKKMIIKVILKTLKM